MMTLMTKAMEMLRMIMVMLIVIMMIELMITLVVVVCDDFEGNNIFQVGERP